MLPTPSVLGTPLFYESGCCPLAPLGLIFRVLFIGSGSLGAVPLACYLRVRVLYGVFLGFWLKFFLSRVGACPKHNSFYFSFLRAVLCGAFLSLVCGGSFLREGRQFYIFLF